MAVLEQDRICVRGKKNSLYECGLAIVARSQLKGRHLFILNYELVNFHFMRKHNMSRTKD